MACATNFYIHDQIVGFSLWNGSTLYPPPTHTQILPSGIQFRNSAFNFFEVQFHRGNGAKIFRFRNELYRISSWYFEILQNHRKMSQAVKTCRA